MKVGNLILPVIANKEEEGALIGPNGVFEESADAFVELLADHCCVLTSYSIPLLDCRRGDATKLMVSVRSAGLKDTPRSRYPII